MSAIALQQLYSIKSNRLRWKSTYYQFFQFQLLHISCFYLLYTEEPNAALLFASGLVNIFLYTRLLLGEIRFSTDQINPIWFYLGMSIMRLGFGTLYVALIIWTEDYWVLQLGVIDPTAWLMDAHLLLLTGDLFFIGGYFWIRRIWPNKHQTVPASYCSKQFQTYKYGLYMTLLAFTLRFVQAFISLGGLGMIVNFVSDYGVPAGIFMMLSSCQQRRKSILHPHMLLALGLLGASVVSGLSSYMKSDLLISLFPLIFLLLDTGLKKNKATSIIQSLPTKHLLLIAFIAYLFLFTISSYSDLRRKGYWQNMTGSETQISQANAPPVLPDLIKALQGSIPGTSEFIEQQHYPNRGVWRMLSRLCVTSWAATAIKLVALSGTRKDSFAGAVLLSITPRVFFPNKPQISWGKEVAVALGQAQSIETAVSATSLSMSGFLYWWGDYIGTIILSLLSGAGFAYVYLLFARNWRINPISALVIMLLAYNGFHWKESDVLGGFPMYLYMLIIFFPLSKLVVKFSPPERKGKGR